jgi:hypothetical protein
MQKLKMISLNRDLGEYSLNVLYTNLIKNYLTNYGTKPVNNTSEPVMESCCCCKKNKISIESLFITNIITVE